MRSAEPFVIRTPTMTRRWRIWAIGDLHLYNKGCIESEIDLMVQEIKDDPYAVWIGLGDYADCITAYDPRFDAQEVAPDKRDNFFERLPARIVDDVCTKFEPIAGQCLGLCRGNHEDKMETRHDIALTKDVCENLSTSKHTVRYLDYSAVFDLIFKSKRKKEEAHFKIFCHHGAGFGTTTGGKINKLKKVMTEVIDADIYMMGHSHEQIDLPLVQLYQDENGVLRQKKKLGVITGSYLATYRDGCTSYGEKKLYSPVTLGSIAVTVVPATRRLGVEKR